MGGKIIKEINNIILSITQSVYVLTHRYSPFGGYDGYNQIYTIDIAKALYNAGYRKQITGEWIFKQTYYEADECNCSICGQLMTTAKGTRMNFCPNCGAQMKGGDE